jgi:radical SAM superfamily enzyme YgiQ (UPF0313 family)
MRLLLINPCNPLVSLANTRESRWNRYRVWKPLGLLVLAGLTPESWEVTIVDENLGLRDYEAMERADLVGITAFTSQANRAYELAAQFRSQGVPVVMGGIHATACTNEALEHVDAVVCGEAESVWAQVLDDVLKGRLERIYEGQHLDMSQTPRARHELLDEGYAFGAIQTTRGCPLNCSFCSVSSFNGNRYRYRPIDQVIEELHSIREKWVLFVDDNLIGTSRAHIARAKELFRAIIASGIRKKWIAQVTINMGDDEELLKLAAQAGCRGVFIGFESPTAEGLNEVGKKFNLSKGRDLRESVRRIQDHNLMVVGSFIMGLDADGPGIGRQIAQAADRYGVDLLNALFLTPLPGTRLWEQMASEQRIAANDFPHDWQFYTLGFPTAKYLNLSWSRIVREMEECDRRFYSVRRVAGRVVKSLLRRRQPILMMVSSMSYRRNGRLSHRTFKDLGLTRNSSAGERALSAQSV